MKMCPPAVKTRGSKCQTTLHGVEMHGSLGQTSLHAVKMLGNESGANFIDTPRVA